MRYGKTLKTSIYPPWKDQYIDYDKLKKLLREDPSTAGSTQSNEEEDDWTEEDEEAFVEELINVQLEKVHKFHAETIQRLKEETTECEQKLEPLGVGVKVEDGEARTEETKSTTLPDEERRKTMEDVMTKLDKITKETSELQRYARLNYTGFFKAGKKHDRRRGTSYRIRPLLRERLSALDFNTEDYSPMLYRLSAMYSFVRQGLDGKDRRGMSFSDSQTGSDTYTSYKFWVHPDNLLEVKTVILRRLPVLVYNSQTSKIAQGSEPDPTVTSIYFDNPKFSLYTKKVTHEPDAPSLRLRWYGQLADNPDVLCEKKVIKEGDVSEEQRFPIKDKYVQRFINGEYKMEKTISRLEERFGAESDRVKQIKASVDDIQSFIKDNQLQPVVRANYARTAFEIPGDDRIRISLDTDLAFIREDAIDSERPCRDPEDWHRSDIDNAQMEYPFTGIRKGEVNRFPFALLEIKIRGRKQYEWITDLMNSHLVKEAPRFSKFVHGVAELFEDYVNSFPFWLSQVESDIRRDPHKAFEEEQERKATAAADDLVVGSLFGPGASPARGSFGGRGNSYKPAKASPIGSPPASQSFQPASTPKATADMTRVVKSKDSSREDAVEEADSDDDGVQASRRAYPQFDGLLSMFSSKNSSSKYARRHRAGNEHLPPGVQKPMYWIKDQGPVRVEAKVWLANQRTFVKWQHVTVLLASLGLGLYNAAGVDNKVARGLAVAYTAVAIFSGVWGWAIYMKRGRMIRTRSGKDFDSTFGPVVICGLLIVALLLNFGFKFHAAMNSQDHEGSNSTMPLLPHAGEL
ncbi:Efflux pump [Venturia nashicola]|uniref:Efflux pump n=1 Tax=Venturia nashicola TaxID=86259 RepID=A0A4Z1P147_9PEZI|nr:Efflux pump [Venturia nashicola]TLD31700.1 Efflux pump [Venturia nashicola]